MSCYHVSTTQPRALRGRHSDECPDPAWHPPLAYRPCRGCQRCTEPHCRRCGIQHAEHTCPGCIADVREDLAKITAMCSALPAEAAAKGIDSEAMNLLGPVSDPEARQHAEASYKAGRLPEGWLETGRHGKKCPLLVNEACTGCGGGEHHPLTFAWWWNECWREAFDHDETPAVSDDYGVRELVGYLDRNLTYAAEQPHLPFEDFARDAAACRRHLEQVLHDGEQIETGAPCMTCRRRLARITEKDGCVVYRCEHCRTDLSEDRYKLAVKDEHIKRAEMLTADDMATRTRVSASTIRRWANLRRIDGIEYEPLIRSCGRNGQSRKVYRVVDVERIRDNGGDTRGPRALSLTTAATVSNDGAEQYA